MYIYIWRMIMENIMMMMNMRIIRLGLDTRQTFYAESMNEFWTCSCSIIIHSLRLPERFPRREMSNRLGSYQARGRLAWIFAPKRRVPTKWQLKSNYVSLICFFIYNIHIDVACKRKKSKIARFIFTNRINFCICGHECQRKSAEIEHLRISRATMNN